MRHIDQDFDKPSPVQRRRRGTQLTTSKSRRNAEYCSRRLRSRAQVNSSVLGRLLIKLSQDLTKPLHLTLSLQRKSHLDGHKEAKLSPAPSWRGRARPPGQLACDSLWRHCRHWRRAAERQAYETENRSSNENNFNYHKTVIM